MPEDHSSSEIKLLIIMIKSEKYCLSGKNLPKTIFVYRENTIKYKENLL